MVYSRSGGGVHGSLHQSVTKDATPSQGGVQGHAERRKTTETLALGTEVAGLATAESALVRSEFLYVIAGAAVALSFDFA